MICSYCQQEFTKDNPLSYDHIKPVWLLRKEKGLKPKKTGRGTNRSFTFEQINNLLISCKKCNFIKDNKTISEFKGFLLIQLNKPHLRSISYNSRLIRTMINSIEVLEKNELNPIEINYFNNP